jgi:hypothetical protein
VLIRQAEPRPEGAVDFPNALGTSLAVASQLENSANSNEHAMKSAALFFSAFQAVLLSAPPIGHVIKWQGVWIDQRTGAQVERGLSVFPDSKLVLKGKAVPRYSIAIRSYINGGEAVYSCAANPCTEPLDLRETLRENSNEKKSGFFEALKEVVVDMAPAGQAHTLSGYTRAISKGAQAQVGDGIAKLTPAGADLSAALQKLKPGAYSVEFCPLAKDGAAQCPGNKAARSLEWSPDRPQSATVSGVRPGLYEIGIYEGGSGNAAPERDSAIVLVVPEKNAADANSRYAEAIRVTEEWDSGEAALARRAYLQYLNKSVNR